MPEALSINRKIEGISDDLLVKLHDRKADTCQKVIEGLTKVQNENADFFIQTGGFDQLRMYEDELRRQKEMADNLRVTA